MTPFQQALLGLFVFVGVLTLLIYFMPEVPEGETEVQTQRLLVLALMLAGIVAGCATGAAILIA